MNKKGIISVIIFLLLVLFQGLSGLKGGYGPLYFVFLTLSIAALFYHFRTISGTGLKNAFAGENTYSLSGVRAVPFIIITVLSVVLLVLYTAKTKAEFYVIPAVTQVILIFAGIMSVLVKPHSGGEKAANTGDTGFWKKESVFIVLIAVFAAVIRFYRIGELPAGVYGEERLFVWKIVDMFSNKFDYSVFVHDISHQMGTAFYLITAFFLEHFGYNLSSFRIFPAAAAVLASVFFYCFLRLFFPRGIAFAGAVFFAGEHLYLHLSRWTHIFQITPVFLWGGLFFLVAGLKTASGRAMVMAGLICGWGLYFYQANKMLPFIFFVYIVYEMLREKDAYSYGLKKNISLLSALLISFLLASLPLIIYIMNSYALYMAHINEVGVNFLNTVKANFSVYAGMFTVKGSSFSMQNFTGRPLLDLVPAALFLFGFGRVLFSLNKRESFIALLILAVGIIPGIFSTVLGGAPFTQRVIIAASSMALFIVIGAGFLSGLGRGKLSRPVSYFMILLLLVLTAFELNTYFNKMKNDNDTRLGFSPVEYDFYQQYKKHSANADVVSTNYFFGGDFNNRSFIGEELYFWKFEGNKLVNIRPHVLDTAKESPNMLLMFPYSGRDVVIIGEAFRKNAAEMIRNRFPNAEIEFVKSPYKDMKADIGLMPLMPDKYDPEIEFVIMRIPAADFEAWSGLRFYPDSGGNRAVIKLMGQGFKSPQPGVIKGSLRVFKQGEYDLNLENFNEPVVEIGMKKRIVKGGIVKNVSLNAGLVPLNIRVKSLTGKEKLTIRGVLSSKYEGLQPGLLVSETADKGVEARYIAGPDPYNTVEKKEFVPLPQFRWVLGSVSECRVRAEVRFKLKIKDSGRYALDAQTGIQGSAEIFADGTRVFNKVSHKDADIKMKPLKAGRADILVRSNCETGTWLNVRLIDLKTGEAVNISESDIL